jgi:hypothetical protein
MTLHFLYITAVYVSITYIVTYLDTINRSRHKFDCR